jgi:hypothetical protein
MIPALYCTADAKTSAFAQFLFSPAVAKHHFPFPQKGRIPPRPANAYQGRKSGGVAISRKSQSHGKQAVLERGSRGRTKTSRRQSGKVEEQIWEAEGFRQGVISIFILFHLIAILCWTIPTNYPFMVGVRGLVGPYMQWAGLAQSWDTFAPNPKAVNSYIKAVVITQHSHMRVFAFPRMEQLGLGERYGKERYRKFAENLVVAGNAAIVPDIARHVARMYKNPTDPPDKVVLVQFVADITPWAHNEDAQRPRPAVFYEDFVEQEDEK